MIICKGLNRNDRITTIKEWYKKCPPEKKEHWKEERSAYELATFWLEKGSIFSPITALLDSHPDTKDITLSCGSPEYESRFDKYGKGRQHDFIALGEQGSNKVFISIEAKVDESFGNETIESYYMKSRIKQLNGDRTRVTVRIEELITTIFEKPLSNAILSLQYQLIHAVAGTLSEAKKQSARKAILIVHTFLTEKANPDKIKENENELNKLIGILSKNQNSKLNTGEIVGPFYVIGNERIPSDVPLYIGKVDT